MDLKIFFFFFGVQVIWSLFGSAVYVHVHGSLLKVKKQQHTRGFKVQNSINFLTNMMASSFSVIVSSVCIIRSLTNQISWRQLTSSHHWDLPRIYICRLPSWISFKKSCLSLNQSIISCIGPWWPAADVSFLLTINADLVLCEFWWSERLGMSV